MMCRPKKRFDFRPEIEAYVHPARVEDGLFIECEVFQPKSSEGRTITLHIPPEWADAMLKALRDYGRDRRMTFDDTLKRSSLGRRSNDN